MSLEAVLSLHRFGVGARPGDRARLADPRGALKAQLRTPQAALISDAGLPSAVSAAAVDGSARRDRRAARAAGTYVPVPGVADVPTALASGDPRLIRRSIQRAEVAARLRHGAATDAGLLERLVLFWSNHFAVSVQKGAVAAMGCAMEREAIRPHVAGRFVDMLKAVSRHPAMLTFLDNQLSFGPASPVGRRRGRGLNENFARELLELHTVGVRAGFAQADVTNLAKILTGWGVRTPASGLPDAGAFVFFPEHHEPGAFTVLGRTYADGGVAQGEAALEDLARHPATARHLARKLARHFIADEPPDGAVDRLERAFLDTGGDLAAVGEALVDCPEAWTGEASKLKTPYEFVLSAARLMPELLDDPALAMRGLSTLGQPSFEPPSPEGWPDEASAWLSPSGIRERLDWAMIAAERHAPAINPETLAADVLGPLLSGEAREEIARAASGAQGLAILLVSPEFQWR